MRIAINILAGLMFGLGLVISGMANPAKVRNFLDLAGTFDPSLICVMLGAVVVTSSDIASRSGGQDRSWSSGSRFQQRRMSMEEWCSVQHCLVSAGACRDSAPARQ